MNALELFTEERPRISVTDVAVELKIPRSSASRLLSAMSKSEIITQVTSRGTYCIGPLARRLGTLYAASVSNQDVIREGMKELAAETGHSCWMSVLVGTNITIIDSIHGGYPIRLMVEIGSQLPGHASAAGKALLSCLDDEKVREIYKSDQLGALTSRTLTTLDDLLVELELIRTRGWAETQQETIDGISSIGVAFTTALEPAGTALSVSYPVTNLTEQQQSDVRHALLKMAAKIGQRIGDTRWEHRFMMNIARSDIDT